MNPGQIIRAKAHTWKNHSGAVKYLYEVEYIGGNGHKMVARRTSLARRYTHVVAAVDPTGKSFRVLLKYTETHPTALELDGWKQTGLAAIAWPEGEL